MLLTAKNHNTRFIMRVVVFMVNDMPHTRDVERAVFSHQRAVK